MNQKKDQNALLQKITNSKTILNIEEKRMTSKYNSTANQDLGHIYGSW